MDCGFNSKRCDYECKKVRHVVTCKIVSIPKGAIMSILNEQLDIKFVVSIPKGAIMSLQRLILLHCAK